MGLKSTKLPALPDHIAACAAPPIVAEPTCKLPSTSCATEILAPAGFKSVKVVGPNVHQAAWERPAGGVPGVARNPATLTPSVPNAPLKVVPGCESPVYDAAVPFHVAAICRGGSVDGL